MPDGQLHHYAPATIERWYLDYKKGGFDALLPASRSTARKSRFMDADIKEQIRYLKTTYPRISSAAISRQLKDNGTVKNGELSESTVNRFVKQLQLEMKLSNNKDMHRYERPHINEVWCGDSSVGPRLTDANGCRQRVYVIALIDDASHFIVVADVFFNDNFINIMSVPKSAVSRAGRQKTLNFDNGKSYRNKQMELRDRAVILLAGLPVLNNTLRLGIHEPLRQRIVMNYNIEGLNKEYGLIYIEEKLKWAGYFQQVFEENAIEAILNAANGIPRLINKVCNASLLVGNSQNLNIINADAVIQAINDCELG